MKGRIFGRDAIEFGANGLCRDRFEPKAPAQRLVMGKQAGDFLIQTVRLGQVHEPDRAASHLVFVGWPDATFGGSDLHRFDICGFAVGVEFAVQAKDQRHVFGDLQIVGRDLDALRCELGDFVHQMMRIEDDAIADDRELSGPHDARGQQRELIDIVVDDERMPGIVAALKAHHDVGLERQPIDDLALAFVAPLGADHHHIRHRTYRFSLRFLRYGAAKNKPGANWLHRVHCGDGVHVCAAGVKVCAAVAGRFRDAPLEPNSGALRRSSCTTARRSGGVVGSAILSCRMAFLCLSL